MSESVLHQPCGLPISEAEEKAIVDKWLRDVRSKGGKSRWKNHEPATKERADPVAVMEVRVATRRENTLRSRVVDGVSPFINGIRLVISDSGVETLEASYTFHGENYFALIPTKEGFTPAWEQASAWIVQKRKEVKAQRAAKKKEKA